MRSPAVRKGLQLVYPRECSQAVLTAILLCTSKSGCNLFTLWPETGSVRGPPGVDEGAMNSRSITLFCQLL